MYSFTPHGNTGWAMPIVVGLRRMPHAVFPASRSRPEAAAAAWYQPPPGAGTRAGRRCPEAGSPRPEAMASPTRTERSATGTEATRMQPTIASGPSCASAAPTATRIRKTISSAKRTRTDEVSAQRPSLALLFTRILGVRLHLAAVTAVLPGPLPRAEKAPSAPWPRLERREPKPRALLFDVERQALCGHPLVSLADGLLGRAGLTRLVRRRDRLDHGLLLGRRRGRRLRGQRSGLFLERRRDRLGGGSGAPGPREPGALPPGEVLDERDEEPRDRHHEHDQRRSQVGQTDEDGKQD